MLDRPCQPDGKIDPRTPSEYGSGMRVVERDASELALRLGSVAGFAGTPTISLSIVYKALTDVSMPVPMLTTSPDARSIAATNAATVSSTNT